LSDARSPSASSLGRTDRRLRRVEGLVPPDEPQLGEHGQARGDVGRHIGPVDAGFACPVGDGGIDIGHTVARRQQGAGGGVQLVGGLGDQVVGHSAVTQRGHQHAGGTLRERRHPGEASCNTVQLREDGDEGWAVGLGPECVADAFDVPADVFAFDDPVGWCGAVGAG
jgi:hypothetical protein